MSVFGHWFGRQGKTRSARVEPQLSAVGHQPKQLDPKPAGDYLLHEWLLAQNNKFGITSDDIEVAASHLPGSLRDNFRFWVPFYLAWLMRDMAGKRYGQEFKTEMMTHVFARLENSDIPEVEVPINTMQTFLNHLDEALRLHMESKEDKDSPLAEFAGFQLAAATRLLLYTNDGLLKDDKQAFADGAFAVAGALTEIADKAGPLIIMVLERTVESDLETVGVSTRSAQSTTDQGRHKLDAEAESERLFRKARRAGWLRNLLRPSDPAMKARAEEERDLVRAVAKDVFYRNLRRFLGSHDDVANAIMCGYNRSEVNDAFLWGILEQFIAGRPSLPSDPHMRLMLHEALFISEEEDIPFVTARERVFSIETKFNGADPLIDTCIGFGRQAFQNPGDEYLISCVRAAISASAARKP